MITVLIEHQNFYIWREFNFGADIVEFFDYVKRVDFIYWLFESIKCIVKHFIVNLQEIWDDSRKGAKEHEAGRFNESDLTLRSTIKIEWQKTS